MRIKQLFLLGMCFALTSFYIFPTSVFAATPWPDVYEQEIGQGVLAEPSGAVVHNDQLWVVSDNGYLASMNVDGSNQSTFYIGGDLEAITTQDKNSDLIYIGIENPDSIIEFNTESNSLTGNSWDLTPYMTGSSNAGLEALTYAQGLFYAGMQETGNIYVFELGTSGVVTHINTVTSPTGKSDLSGFDNQDGVFYAIYDSYNVLVTLDSSLAVIEEFDLAGDSQEGIALLDNDIFIAEDSGEIWSYAGFLPEDEPEEPPVEEEPEPDPEPEVSLDVQVGTASINSNWTSVTFDQTFDEVPVVIAEIQTEFGGHMAYTDLRNITETGFQMRVEEDRGLQRNWMDGWHKYEDVAWLALTPTAAEQVSGIEVGTTSFRQSSGSYIEVIEFEDVYSGIPTVFAQIQTENGWHTSKVDILNISETQMGIRVEEDMGSVSGWDGVHTAEDISYIVLAPEFDLSGLGIMSGDESIDQDWQEVCFVSDCSAVFDQAPSVFVEIQSELESDTVQTDIKDVTESSFYIRLEEQTKAGWDGIHIAEQISWMAF